MRQYLNRCGRGERSRPLARPSTVRARLLRVRARSLTVAIVAATAGAALVGCARSSPAPTQPPLPTVAAPETMTVHSAAVTERDTIRPAFTCDGQGARFPLSWAGAPAATRSLAIVIEDPDAPGGTYVHEIVAGLASTATSWDAGAAAPDAGTAARDAGEASTARTVMARNSHGEVGYTPPCPPAGPAHHYRFIVVALGTVAPFAEGADPAQALAAINGAAIAQGVLVALYARH